MHLKKSYRHLILFAFLALTVLSTPEAEAQTDSLYLHLDSTTFVTEKHSSAIQETLHGVTKIDVDMIQSLPKILGNTDPVNFIRNLPGVQTSSEYDSGIHIQGCDNSHNDISLGGVPVFGASHLFGLFSIFNPTHYSKMEFRPSSGASNRLGGMLNMALPDTLDKRFSGDINVGIMSAQGTLGIRIGRHSHLRVSARNSYMNLLYKRWLKILDSPIRYSFGDYNLTWMYSYGKDRVWVDSYFGKDNAEIAERRFSTGLKERWGNCIGALHWMHEGSKVRHSHSLYFSRFDSKGLITQEESVLDLSNFINAAGYKGKAEWLDFTSGADLTYYHVQPQFPIFQGLYGADAGTAEIQSGLETSLYTDYRKTLAGRWDIKAGLRGSLYMSPEKDIFWGLSPGASVSFNAYRYGRVSVSYNLSRQYIFQTGLSNIGLPINFWFMAGKHSKPQHSHNFDISYKAEMFRGALSVSASTYCKLLHNQVEYYGDVMDFFSSVYSLDSHLLKGKGWNYGINLMIHKQTGSLTGWISYSLGRALRKFDNPGFSKIYPANHERIHELNAVCSYRLSKWDFAGTFVYASGAPFTAPESFYISSGQLMTLYGEHNACRMRPYIRLDLSVTYTIIRNSKQENGINVSIYNVLARENDVMYRLNLTNGAYSYGPSGFFLKFLPSISYFHKF